MTKTSAGAYLENFVRAILLVVNSALVSFGLFLVVPSGTFSALPWKGGGAVIAGLCFVACALEAKADERHMVENENDEKHHRRSLAKQFCLLMSMIVVLSLLLI